MKISINPLFKRLSNILLVTAVLLPAAGLVEARAQHNISGRWDSAFGISFDIEQKGNYIIWENSDKVTGTGEVVGNEVIFKWTKPDGEHSIHGEITELNPDGLPLVIKLDDGNELVRVHEEHPLPPPDERPPDIAGEWQSNHGAIFNIMATGDHFEWVNSNKEQGEIRFAEMGMELIHAELVVHGEIIDVGHEGIPTRIRWDNGLELFRQVEPPPEQPKQPPAGQPKQPPAGQQKKPPAGQPKKPQPPQGGKIKVKISANPTSVTEGQITVIEVKALSGKNIPIPDADVVVSTGGGEFLATKGLSDKGKTDTSGIFKTSWHCPKCAPNYLFTAKVTKAGFTQGEAKTTVSTKKKP